jgi:hypothetical protein
MSRICILYLLLACYLTATPAKVILAIFAGRQKYMRILEVYLIKLIDMKLVDVVELWDFTEASDTYDHGYLKSLASRRDQFKFKHMSDEERRLHHTWRFMRFYNHYALKGALAEDDILMKVDDDIVFIDLQNFQHYLDVIRMSHGIVYPNIVNNEVGAYVQALYGIPEMASGFNESFFQDLHVKNLTAVDELDFDNIPAVKPATNLYTNPDRAQLAHDLFLNQTHRFVFNTTDIVYTYRRIPLNFYGGTGAVMRTAFHFYCNESFSERDMHMATDERFLAVWLRKYTGYGNKIVPKMVVVHFAHSHQHRAVWSDPYLVRYHDFALSYTKNFANKK